MLVGILIVMLVATSLGLLGGASIFVAFFDPETDKRERLALVFVGNLILFCAALVLSLAPSRIFVEGPGLTNFTLVLVYVYSLGIFIGIKTASLPKPDLP